MIPAAGSWGPAGFWEEKALHFIAQDEADSHRIGKAFFARAARVQRQPAAVKGKERSKYWFATSSQRSQAPRQAWGDGRFWGGRVRLPNVSFVVESGRSIKKN
jgi:hypothetical protein